MQVEYKKCRKRKVLIRAKQCISARTSKIEESHPFQGQRQVDLEVMLMKKEKKLKASVIQHMPHKQCSMWS